MLVTELAEAVVAWTAHTKKTAATIAAAFAETPPCPLIAGESSTDANCGAIG
jgi:hypothetical protein